MRRATRLAAAALIVVMSLLSGSPAGAADEAPVATATVHGQVVTLTVRACTAELGQRTLTIGLPRELSFPAGALALDAPVEAHASLSGGNVEVEFGTTPPFGTCVDVAVGGTAEAPGLVRTAVQVAGKTVPVSFRINRPDRQHPRIAVLPGVDRCEAADCRTFVASMPVGPQPQSTLRVTPLAGGRIDCSGLYTELARLDGDGRTRRTEPWELGQRCTPDSLTVAATKTWAGALFRVQVPVVGKDPLAEVLWVGPSGRRQTATATPDSGRVTVQVPRWTHDQVQEQQAAREQGAAGRRALVVLFVLVVVALAAVPLWRLRNRAPEVEPPAEADPDIAYTPPTATDGDEAPSEGEPPVTEQAEETLDGSTSLSSAMTSITALRRQAEQLLSEAGAIRAQAVSEAEGIIADAVASAEQIIAETRQNATRAESGSSERARKLVETAQVEAEAANRRAQEATRRAEAAAALADHDIQGVRDLAASARSRVSDELDARRDELIEELETAYRQQRDLLEQRTREQFDATTAEMDAWRKRYAAEVKAAWQLRLAEVEQIASTLGASFSASSATLTDALAGLARLREQAGIEAPAPEPEKASPAPTTPASAPAATDGKQKRRNRFRG